MELRVSYDAPVKTYRVWDALAEIDGRVVVEITEEELLAALPTDQGHLVSYAPVAEHWCREIARERLTGVPMPQAVESVLPQEGDNLPPADPAPDA